MGGKQENIILAKYSLFTRHSQAPASGSTQPGLPLSLPTPVGWQTSAPAEPPLAAEAGDTQGLVTDTRMH